MKKDTNQKDFENYHADGIKEAWFMAVSSSSEL
jgi:hypothetical protein